MGWIRNLSIRGKLLGAVGLIVALSLAAIVVLKNYAQNNLDESQQVSLESIAKIRAQYMESLELYETSASLAVFDDLANEDVGALKAKFQTQIDEGVIRVMQAYAGDGISLISIQDKDASSELLSRLMWTDGIKAELAKMADSNPLTQVIRILSADQRFMLVFRRFGQRDLSEGWIISCLDLSRFEAIRQELLVRNAEFNQQSSQKFFLITALALLVMLVAGGLGIIFFTKSIVEPLREVVQGTRKVATGDFNVVIRSQNRDEIGKLTQNFNDMTASLGRSFQEIMDHRTNLESKIQERTAEIVEKGKKIQNILNSIDEGILTINSDLRIDPEYSAFLGRLYRLDQKDISQRDFVDILFEKGEVSDDQKAMMRECMSISINMDCMNFEGNSGNLPQYVNMHDDSHRRILELHWVPIVNSQDVTERVLVSIRDVTAIRELEVRIEEERKRSQEQGLIIQHILSGDRQRLFNFIQSAAVIMRECMEKLETPSPDLKALLLQLHTLKGASRTLKFNNISNGIHSLESLLKEVGPNKLLNRMECTRLFTQSLDELGRYSQVATSVFSFSQTQKYGALKNLHSIASQAIPTLSETLKKNNIPLGTFEVLDGIIDWDDTTLELIYEMLIHAFNNAVDHGFVRPTQKGLLNRNAEFSLQSSKQDGRIVVTFKENGYGLDFNRLKEIAKDRNYAWRNEPDLINLIFEDEVSTAEYTSQLSGRGVGMKAIRKMAIEKGGSVELKPLKENYGTQLTIDLPEDRQVSELARVS
jgi:HAMP domain-containing protein